LTTTVGDVEVYESSASTATGLFVWFFTLHYINTRAKVSNACS
jgi:hypothetical protein